MKVMKVTVKLDWVFDLTRKEWDLAYYDGLPNHQVEPKFSEFDWRELHGDTIYISGAPTKVDVTQYALLVAAGLIIYEKVRGFAFNKMVAQELYELRGRTANRFKSQEWSAAYREERDLINEKQRRAALLFSE